MSSVLCVRRESRTPAARDRRCRSLLALKAWAASHSTNCAGTSVRQEANQPGDWLPLGSASSRPGRSGRAARGQQGPHKPLGGCSAGRSWGMGSGSSGKGEPCWRGIEQAPDHAGRKAPHAHDMVHIDREVVHGSFPPPRHMEGLCWQREPSSSGKHFKEGGIKKVADEAPEGSNTG